MADQRYINISDGFWLVDHSRGISSMNEEHRHDCYEIYLYLGQEMTQFIQDRNYTLRNRDMALIDRRVYHKTRYAIVETDRERVLVMFGRDGLRLIDSPLLDGRLERLFAFRKLRFGAEADRRAVEECLMRLSQSCFAATGDLARLRTRLQLCELVAMLIELQERGAITADREELNNGEQRVAAVVRYLNAHYASNIRLEELARRFFISRFTLCHEFKGIIGETVMGYLARKRLDEACRLLRETDQQVTGIAQSVGYRSINCFNEQFRYSFHCTPRQYRAQARSPIDA